MICGLCLHAVEHGARHGHDACMRNIINEAIERCAVLATLDRAGNQPLAEKIRAQKIQFTFKPEAA